MKNVKINFMNIFMINFFVQVNYAAWTNSQSIIKIEDFDFQI